MNLYKATADDWVYDQYSHFIVAAETAAEARRLVGAYAAANGCWSLEQRWRIRRLSIPKRPGIVLGSFHAG